MKFNVNESTKQYLAVRLLKVIFSLYLMLTVVVTCIQMYAEYLDVKEDASREGGIDKIKYGIILIIINSIVKTTALWVLFIFFIHPMVVRPLLASAKAIADLSTGDRTRNTLSDGEWPVSRKTLAMTTNLASSVAVSSRSFTSLLINNPKIEFVA